MPRLDFTFALGQQLVLASTYLVLALFCLCVAAYLQLRRSYEQVRRAKQEWVGTVDAIEDLIFSHDEQGRLLRVNRRMADRLLVTPAELIGRTVQQAFP